MFHLYFGAFDLVLYTGGVCVALLLSKAFNEEQTAMDMVDLHHEDVLSTLALRPAKSDIDFSQMLEVEEEDNHELMLEA